MKTFAAALLAVLLGAPLVPAAEGPLDKLPENTIVTARFDSVNEAFKTWNALAVKLGPPAAQTPLGMVVGMYLRNPLYAGIDLNRPAALAVVVPLRPAAPPRPAPDPDAVDEALRRLLLKLAGLDDNDPPIDLPEKQPDKPVGPDAIVLRPGPPTFCLLLPLSDPEAFSNLMASRNTPFDTKIVGQYAAIGAPGVLNTLGRYELPDAFAYQAPVCIKIDVKQVSRILRLDPRRPQPPDTEWLPEENGYLLDAAFFKMAFAVGEQVLNDGRSFDIALDLPDNDLRIRYALAPRPDTPLTRMIADAKPIDPALVRRLPPTSRVVAVRTGFLHPCAKALTEDFRAAQAQVDTIDDATKRRRQTAIDALSSLMLGVEEAALSREKNPRTGAVNTVVLLGGNGPTLRRRLAEFGRSMHTLSEHAIPAAPNDIMGVKYVLFEDDFRTVEGVKVACLRSGYRSPEGSLLHEMLMLQQYDSTHLIAAVDKGLLLVSGPDAPVVLSAMLGGRELDGRWPAPLPELLKRDGVGLAATDTEGAAAWSRHILSCLQMTEPSIARLDVLMKDIHPASASTILIDTEDGRLRAEHRIPGDALRLYGLLGREAGRLIFMQFMNIVMD